MKFPQLVEGTFVERLNRFAITAKIGGIKHRVFMANPGRMKELMIPGVKVLLSPASNPERRTRFDLTLIRHKGIWVSLNSHLANKLFQEALEKKKLAEFDEMTLIRPEISVGDSRLDFLLGHKGQKVYVEVKSCTLVEQGHARFPDAPTTRGARHVRELAALVQKGHQGIVVFVIQRNDAVTFSPNWDTDPDFSRELVAAEKRGVKVYAYKNAVGPKRIGITGRVDIILPGQN